jgi:hypothetical protein
MEDVNSMQKCRLQNKGAHHTHQESNKQEARAVKKFQRAYFWVQKNTHSTVAECAHLLAISGRVGVYTRNSSVTA